MAFRDKIRGVLEVRDTPHRIAVSFAIGIFWGLSPLLGLHMIGAFSTAWLFGLNRFVAIAGGWIINPWTIIPIYSFSLWFGARLVGMKKILPVIDWNNVTFIHLLAKLKGLVLPFFVGNFVIGAVSAVLSYFIIHAVLIKYKDRKGNRIKDAA